MNYLKSLIIVIFLPITFSCNELHARKNLKNLEKVEIGMSKEEVIKIMGSPISCDTIYRDGRCLFFLYYDPPFGASSGIGIFLDSTSQKVYSKTPKSEF